jgi:hypothetical protein
MTSVPQRKVTAAVDANHASGLDEAPPGLWTTEDRRVPRSDPDQLHIRKKITSENYLARRIAELRRDAFSECVPVDQHNPRLGALVLCPGTTEAGRVGA